MFTLGSESHMSFSDLFSLEADQLYGVVWLHPVPRLVLQLLDLVTLHHVDHGGGGHGLGVDEV